MNYKFLFILFLQIALAESYGQSFERENHTWETTNKKEIKASFLDNSAIYLMYHVMVEFNSAIESDKQQYYVTHSKILLQEAKALDRYNKFYLSQKDSDVSSTDLRIIKSDGTVIEVDNKDVKEGIEEESGISYLYYAIDGLELGDIIESIVKIKKVAQFYGSLEYIQQAHPVVDYYFEFIYPNHLEYGFKTFNADIQSKSEKLSEEKTRYSISTQDIPSISSQSFTFANANRQFHIYKLDKNNSSGSYDVNGYGHMSQAIGERALNYPYTKDELKELNKLYKQVGITKNDDIKKKVHTIEHFLKSNFTFLEDNWERATESIETILYTNSFNYFGALKIYDFLLEKAGINCQAIMTCDKREFEFDEDFESYIFLNKLFVYIEEIDTALDPSNGLSRLHFYDTGYQGHKGLYVKSKEIGGQTVAIGKTKEIRSSSSDENLTKAYIDVNLTSDFDEMKIKIRKELYGQVALMFQPLFSVVDETRMEDFKSYVIYAYPGQFESSSVKFTNTEAEAFPLKPLICEFDLKNEDFWEKGGHSFLFKLGALIGPQSQLYNESTEERVLDIQSDIARRYTYEIIFNIPENMEPANLDDININIEDNSPDYTYYFKSSYKVANDKVIVSVDEIYDRAEYPASEFVDFQKVINAAADFNKVKIVFKPK